MIKKISLIILCLSISSCGGFTYVAGLKFKKEVGAKTHGGNPGFTSDTTKLSNGIIIGFDRPIGKCGGGLTFFGILLPVIPVWFTMNSCEKEFVIVDAGGDIKLDLKLKYNGNIYEPNFTGNKVTYDGNVYAPQTNVKGEIGYSYSTPEFKFKIDNFWQFRMADDKAIIVIGKTKDGKEFTEELPVKWGVMTYNNWAIP
jgi:hypothetical protein